ncbi:hypothetical protein J6590_044151 [Homalodisca vitripennis]|nr:hypothetical protein J6590_044151 [Homalodisca vitripennis]
MSYCLIIRQKLEYYSTVWSHFYLSKSTIRKLGYRSNVYNQCSENSFRSYDCSWAIANWTPPFLKLRSSFALILSNSVVRLRAFPFSTIYLPTLWAAQSYLHLGSVIPQRVENPGQHKIPRPLRQTVSPQHASISRLMKLGNAHHWVILSPHMYVFFSAGFKHKLKIIVWDLSRYQLVL